MARLVKPQIKKQPKDFWLMVYPDDHDLSKAIEAGGFCTPQKCWERMCVYRSMEELAPGKSHHIHVDAGHVRIHYNGWRYIADVPRHVKLSLMLFDAKRYDEIRIRNHKLHFRRTTKVVPVPRARQDQINAARRERVAAGGNEYRRNYQGLRKRVIGFAMH